MRLAPIAALLVTVVAPDLAGCRTGTLGRKTGERPLTLPKGEHQFLVAGGAIFEADPVEYDAFAGLLEYRYGITDDIEIEWPARMRYRFGQRDTAQLSVGGGFTGLGVTTGGRAAANRGDPRSPNAQVSAILWTIGGGAFAKVPLSGRFALLGGVRANTTFSNARPDNTLLQPVLLTTFDLGEYVSISPSVGASIGFNHTKRSTAFALSFGGLGYDGGATVPLLSFHIFDQIDAIVATGVGWAPDSDDVGFSVMAGVDWHFANPQ